VVLLSDGGGKVQAALKPIYGVDKVLRFLAGVRPESLTLEPAWLNGAPSMRFIVDSEVDSVAGALIQDGRVTSLYIVRNPDKLIRLGGVTEITRA
jgi:RNA polymerase sigma-70 factor (ECF subfamily)